MKENLLFFPAKKNVLKQPPVCPAEHYAFVGKPSTHLDHTFLEKAAAFQEIRDCLAAADRLQVSPPEAEARIAFYVRAYLYPDQVG